MDYCRVFKETISRIIDELLSEERNNIDKAAEVLSNAITRGGFIYVFGTGHSMLIALEMFYRAGGLVRIFPLIDISLSALNGALKSTFLERLPGYAKALLASTPI
ncbi:MAG: SIS domain-containing protein, partial [Ignisphaera sp.]